MRTSMGVLRGGKRVASDVSNASRSLVLKCNFANQSDKDRLGITSTDIRYHVVSLILSKLATSCSLPYTLFHLMGTTCDLISSTVQTIEEKSEMNYSYGYNRLDCMYMIWIHKLVS